MRRSFPVFFILVLLLPQIAVSQAVTAPDSSSAPKPPRRGVFFAPYYISSEKNARLAAINARMAAKAAKLYTMRMPALAAIPPLPPMPALPPMPPLPAAPFYAMPHYLHYSFENFFSKEYAESLTDDEQIKIQALAGLLSQDETTALPEIKKLARQHPNWAMRAAAISVLAGAESTEALTILDEALQQDADHRVRLAAVRALSNRSEPEAREILKRLLSK
jgi:hypothetical protein